MLEAYQKEETLLRSKIESRLAELNPANAKKCQGVAEYAVATVGSTVLGRYLFDSFQGGDLCIVSSRIAHGNQHVIEPFRRGVGELELATALWPKMKRVRFPNAQKYWAVLINDCENDYWEDLVREIYVKGEAFGRPPCRDNTR